MCALFCSSLTKLRDSSFVYQLSGSSYSLASSPTKQENRRDEIQTDNSNSNNLVTILMEKGENHIRLWFYS